MRHSVPAATGELSMMRVPLLVLVTVALAGCQSALERQEIADDQSCRKIISERNDASPTAYKDCRANFQQYRQQAAVRSISIDTTPVGPPHHWSLD
jgi:hypothetical protein